MTRRLSDLSLFAAGRPSKLDARSGEARVIWAVGCLTAAPQKSHKSASRGAPTRIPLFRRMVVPGAMRAAVEGQPAVPA